MHGAETGRLFEARAEPQPAASCVPGQRLVEPGFHEPGAAVVKQFDLALVGVDAEHIVADLGHAGSVGGAQVPAPDHGQPHRRGASIPDTAWPAIVRLKRQFGPYAAGMAAWLPQPERHPA
jgi:hypothetical protein